MYFFFNFLFLPEGTCDPDANIALNKPAAQSSVLTLRNGRRLSADQAVDGESGRKFIFIFVRFAVDIDVFSLFLSNLQPTLSSPWSRQWCHPYFPVHTHVPWKTSSVVEGRSGDQPENRHGNPDQPWGLLWRPTFELRDSYWWHAGWSHWRCS